MSKPELTKNFIAERFKELVADSSYDKVSVQSIIRDCAINRKTFYYHFLNKSDLTCYIFRSEFSQLLSAEFPAENLVAGNPQLDDQHGRFAYYYVGDSEVWQPRFFQLFSKYFESNGDFYRKVFRSSDWSYFSDYIFMVYRPQLRREIVSGMERSSVHLTNEETEYLAAYFTNASVIWVINRHMTKVSDFSDTTKSHLSRLILDAMDGAIDGQRRRKDHRSIPPRIGSG